MNTYFTLLTVVGAAELVSAKISEQTVALTHLALGDGNGDFVVPLDSMIGLVHEVHRVPISSVTEDAGNPNRLVIEAVIPVADGGFTIREVGLIGGITPGDKLLAVGNFPATYKPTPAEGATKDLVIRMIVQISNTGVVEIVVDPSIVIASSQTVILAVQAHEAAVNPHPGYLTRAEGDVRYRNPGRYFFGQF